jgi:hypothetical protein
MSKRNKANKDHYMQAGRLSQDEMARERMNQAQVSARAKSKENVIGKIPEHDGQASSRPRSAPEE